MARPLSLKSTDTRSVPLMLPRISEPVSILSALPFLPDQDLEAAIARSGRENTKEAGYALEDAMRASFAAMECRASWYGSRVGEQRFSEDSLDRAMLLSRKVRRLTARIPVSFEIGGWKGPYATVQDYLKAHQRDFHTQVALRHAEGRAKYQIGWGLLDAACAIADGGLLSEARVFFGGGQKRPERLLIRDAVFAAEDQPIEDMLRILIDAPNAVAQLYDSSADVRHTSEIEPGVTPLIYVHCSGVKDDLEGRREVVLEAVDFGSVDTLYAYREARRRRSEAMFSWAQDALTSRLGV